MSPSTLYEDENPTFFGNGEIVDNCTVYLIMMYHLTLRLVGRYTCENTHSRVTTLNTAIRVHYAHCEHNRARSNRQ